MDSDNLAKIGNVLLWIGDSIILLTFVLTNNNWLKLRAADIKLFAGFIFVASVYLEGEEIASSKGVLPEQYTPKITGVLISQLGAVILICVLYYELKVKSSTGRTPITSPFIGPIGNDD
ncbi:hypothetical protein Sgly_2783 [Syntrophobotulus glycolicus DSM 8271]|uniref:Uncharacterized protein n=1 Tax=Syntrophobotulus glycolicus (strain DSM 8271 / FlGlyR) TaxID=645991 RepID=F0SYE2_SYNGF|nr:hypothetical protein [Syntrophobotulus glycolicus]ADY57054.1 hypothetical protein Sgly_2783 [Syntrophobotulus glycolicus DSM 8271]